MKKSFTLIELMISIIIFSLLILYMSNVLTTLKVSSNKIIKKYHNLSNNYTIQVLYNDLLLSSNIKINNKNKNFSIVYLQTSNSLYKIPMPYVIWYVSKKGSFLMRLENSDKLILPTKKGYLDKFDKVKIFKIYQNKNKYFIYLENKKPIYFMIKK